MLAGLQRMQTTGNVGMRHEQDMQPGAGWLWSPGRLQNQLELGKPNRAEREQLAESRAWVKGSQKLSC